MSYDEVSIEPIAFGTQWLTALRTSRRFKMAARIARSRADFEQPDSPEAAKRLSEIHANMHYFGEQLIKKAPEYGSIFPWYGQCCPCWYRSSLPFQYCDRYRICPFCYSRRLALAAESLLAGCYLYIPSGYEFVAIRHRQFLPKRQQDQKLKELLKRAAGAPKYIMDRIPQHLGGVWSTTLEPALHKATGRGDAFKLRTAGILLLQANQQLEVPRGWEYRTWHAVADLESIYRLSEMVFRFPQRLLFCNDWRSAARAECIMRGSELHVTFNPKQ